jgi:hypothetical protein
VNPHIISLELIGGREGCCFRKLHYQLLYNLSFSYLLVNLLLWFIFILHLSFITDSSLPTVPVDFNERQSSGTKTTSNTSIALIQTELAEQKL